MQTPALMILNEIQDFWKGVMCVQVTYIMRFFQAQ